MKSLYRKYRPLRLADVVGQAQVTDVLAGALKAGKVGHAYLFVGPRGTGKTSVARIFAHEINGFAYELEDDYVDIIEIDGASNRGIDNIRELREKAAIAPTRGKYKIYIIDEVHMLTKEAFNALLKTLEEPPAHVVFIMATTDMHKVPITITSRAQTYKFKLADRKVMFDFLKSIAEKEKIKINNGALDLIVKRGGGSFRDSLSLLDQISTLSDSEITKELVASVMGLPEDEKINGLLSAYADGDASRMASILKELLSEGIKPETLAEELINVIIANPEARLMPLLKCLPEVKEPFADARLLAALMANVQATSSAPPLAGAQKPVPAPSPDSTAEATKPIVAAPTKAFDWDLFLQEVFTLNETIHKQLTKCEYEFKNNALHLYPRTKIIKNILTSRNNQRILLSVAKGMKIEIHEAGEHPDSASKDETLLKISDIMGGEVKHDHGGNDPF
ncbi:MAG: DNA polymerase III subunit gamma/tau [Candidatus Saccharibacteria bacterium]|nr:DNA polymerase III subunit gamma/tau [Candidatus Saccharibacteria bacterium]